MLDGHRELRLLFVDLSLSFGVRLISTVLAFCRWMQRPALRH